MAKKRIEEVDPPIYNNIFEESFYGYVKNGSRSKFTYIKEHSMLLDMNKKSKFIPALIVLILFTAASFFMFDPAGATMSHFYPSSCLGGWSNPSNAQGKPQVAGKSSIYYNESNSAVLKDKISQIYCGSFEGEIPQDAQVKTVTLKLSWANTLSGNFTLPETVTDGVYDPENKVNDDNSMDVIESNDEGVKVQTSEENEVNKNVDTAESVQDTPEIIIESQPDTNNEPMMDTNSGSSSDTDDVLEETDSVSDPLSFSNIKTSLSNRLMKFPKQWVKKVFAEDREEELSELNDQSVEYAEKNKYFSIYYSIDGSNWNKISDVGESNFYQDGYELPLSELYSVGNISKLQISIRGAETMEDELTFYLDGMSVEVGYETLTSKDDIKILKKEQLKDTPRIKIDSEYNNKRSVKNFNIHEDVEVFFDLGQVNEFAFKKREEAAKNMIEVEQKNSEDKSQSEQTQVKINDESSPKSTAIELLDDMSGESESDVETIKSSPEPESSSEEAWYYKAFKYVFTRTNVVSAQEEEKPGILNVELYSKRKGKIDFDFNIKNDGDQVKVVVPTSKNSFLPGEYTMLIEVEYDGDVYVLQEDFSLGVLAVNFNKTIYTPGEMAYVQMATLSDIGNTICDSNLELMISHENGEERMYTTESGKITKNESCDVNNNVTDSPDYFVRDLFFTEGKYEVVLKNIENEKTLTDSFEVRNDEIVEVERIGATRINPFKSLYTMRIKILANRKFKGDIVEKIPAGFTIHTQGAKIKRQGTEDYEGLQTKFTSKGKDDGKIFIWENIKVDTGDELLIEYTYEAPRISPQFYLVGPMEIKKSRNFITEAVFGDEVLFQEIRAWQIASDASLTVTIPFDTTSESWTGNGGTGTVDSYQSGAGNPAGSIQSRISGRNNTNATAGWRQTGITWESLGVPVNSVINSVDGTYSWRISEWNVGNINSASGNLYITDDASGNSFTLENGVTVSGTTAWATRNALGTVSVPSALQSSNASIILNLIGHLQTANNNSAVVARQMDTVTLVIDYTPPAVQISISGKIYVDEGITALNCSVVGSRTVRVVVNGGTSYTGTCTNSTGDYTISNISAISGNPLAIYIDNATEKASVITRTPVLGNVTNLDLYQNNVILRSDDDFPISITDIAKWDNDNDADMQFKAETSSYTCRGQSGFVGLCMDAEKRLIVWNGKTFAPVANDVMTDSFLVQTNAIYSPVGNNLTLWGSGTGTSRPLQVNGSWVSEDGTTVYKGIATTDVEPTSYGNLELKPTSGSPTYRFGINNATTTIAGSFTIGDGTNAVTVDTTTYNPNIVLNTVEGNLEVSNNATLSGSGTGTITVVGDIKGVGTINLTAGTVEMRSAGEDYLGTTSGSNDWNFNNLLFSSSGLFLDTNLPAGTGTNVTDVGSIAWSNPGNITQSNNVRATALLSGNSQTNYLQATNFGFSIPFGSEILGIEAVIERHSGSTAISDNRVSLVKDLTILNTNKAIGSWNTADEEILYGGSSDQWGEVWESADINNANFGIVLSASRGGGGGTVEARVDNIKINVYYIVAGRIYTQTGGTGKIVVAELLQIGQDSDDSITSLYNDLNDRSLETNGHLLITSHGRLLSSNSEPLNLRGDYSNYGTFINNSGEVILSGTNLQQLSGTMTDASSFNTLTITNSSGTDPDTDPSVSFLSPVTAASFTAVTPSTKLRFNAGSVYTFGNFDLNGQGSGTKIFLRSSTSNTPWNLAVTGIQSVSHIDTKDSNATGGNLIAADDGTNTNSGGNTNWDFGSGETLSCGTNVTEVTFSNLDISTVHTSNLDVVTTFTCGSATGCELFVSDEGDGINPGLYATSSTHLIPSLTTTLSAGTEGYGIQAETTGNGSGETLSINATYDKTGNSIGGLTFSNSTLAVSSGAFTSREVLIRHKAASALTTPVDTYNDTITYSCLSN